MKIDFLTIFPNIIEPYLNESILKRAQLKKLVNFYAHNLRKWTNDPHHKVDAHPYGGGAGMLMKLEPFFKAIKQLVYKHSSMQVNQVRKHTRIIMMSPTGKTFTQKDAARLSKYDRLIFLCGRYEGFDARIEKLVDEKISVGDYVLSGGELPALTITETVVRLIPGVLGNTESLKEESFGQLPTPNYQPPTKEDKKSKVRSWKLEVGSCARAYHEYPHYTRPAVFVGTWRGKKIKWAVPEVLLSGDHAKVAEWRKLH